LPASHSWPGRHAASQLPQCGTVVLVSTHAPPQNVVGAGHWHMLFVQTWPLMHAGVQTEPGGKH
jgi:hypothetical protein